VTGGADDAVGGGYVMDEEVYKILDLLREANRMYRETGQEVITLRCPFCGGSVTVQYYGSVKRSSMRCDGCELVGIS
jgi:hypothetical protein